MAGFDLPDQALRKEILRAGLGLGLQSCRRGSVRGQEPVLSTAVSAAQWLLRGSAWQKQTTGEERVKPKSAQGGGNGKDTEQKRRPLPPPSGAERPPQPTAHLSRKAQRQTRSKGQPWCTALFHCPTLLAPRPQEPVLLPPAT